MPKGVPRGKGGSAECGTRSGYTGHRKRGEDPCTKCRKANADYQRQYRTGRAENLPEAFGAKGGENVAGDVFKDVPYDTLTTADFRRLRGYG